MSPRLRRVAALAALAAATPAIALAQHHEGPHADVAGAGTQVAIRATSVDPARVTVLVGERVDWVNASRREHTVTARDGSFDSPRLRAGRRFSHPFGAAGSVAYFCRIHPNITGTVDVARVLVRASASQAVRGERLTLEGRALPGDGPVTLERDAGSGFAPVATAARGPGGAFRAQVVAEAPASYRAVAGPDTSAPVRVEVVGARALRLWVVRERRHQRVRVTVAPGLPGGTIHLQRPLRERFGWWTTHRARLAHGRHATLTLPRRSRAPVRVVLTQPDGETAVAVSRVVTPPG